MTQSVSMNLYTLPSMISSSGYQTHRLIVPNIDEASVAVAGAGLFKYIFLMAVYLTK